MLFVYFLCFLFKGGSFFFRRAYNVPEVQKVNMSFISLKRSGRLVRFISNERGPLLGPPGRTRLCSPREKIINNNKQLGKYFIDIYEFTIHVYKGGLCYDEEHNKDLSKHVIFAYIELINGWRYENQESCFLNKSILELWGDKNSWFTKSSGLKIKDKDLFK